MILDVKLESITQKPSEPEVDLKPAVSEYSKEHFFTVLEPELKKYGGRRIFSIQQQNAMVLSVLQDTEGLKLVFVVESQRKVYFSTIQYPSKNQSAGVLTAMDQAGLRQIFEL